MLSKIKEGEVYKVVTVFGRTFELCYGYYEEYERQSRFNELVPIYPDFINNPVYTDDGIPIVTEMQPVCSEYDGDGKTEVCFGCRYFNRGEELFGTCLNINKRK